MTLLTSPDLIAKGFELRDVVRFALWGDDGADKKAARLVDDGADITIIQDGYNVFPQALSKGMWRTADAMIKAGAKLDVAYGAPDLPVFYAIASGCRKTTRVVLRAHCDLDARRPNGFTMLHNAAYLEQHGMVRFLLKIGCDPLAPISDKDKRTPLDIAKDLYAAALLPGAHRDFTWDNEGLDDTTSSVQLGNIVNTLEKNVALRAEKQASHDAHRKFLQENSAIVQRPFAMPPRLKLRR